jgi:hypothetical protein
MSVSATPPKYSISGLAPSVENGSTATESTVFLVRREVLSKPGDADQWKLRTWNREKAF